MNQVLIPMIHAFFSFSFIQLQFPSSSIKLVPQRFVLLYSNIGISKEIAFINVPVFSFSAKNNLELRSSLLLLGRVEEDFTLHSITRSL